MEITGYPRKPQAINCVRKNSVFNNKSNGGNSWKSGEIEFPYLAKVGVEGSNPFARSNFSTAIDKGSAVSSHVDAISV
ncbi:MAG: hypothetical protein WBW00_03345 [Pseudolabrys sp.]